jgi:RNA polymerase sigma factor (sigma-70 family)
MTTDEALMLAVCNGDIQQLEVLFKRHVSPLFDFFYRMTGNRSLSEDLAQEVFLRLLKYRTTFRSGNRFTTWLYQIARNVRIDHFNNHPIENPLDEASAVSHHSPARQYEAAQRAAIVQQALLCLPADKRELLILFRYRDLKHAEIGELLGVDAGTVKVRVHRAIKDLREIVLKLSEGKKTCAVKN